MPETNAQMMERIEKDVSEKGLEGITPRTRRLAELQSSGALRDAIERGLKRYGEREQIDATTGPQKYDNARWDKFYQGVDPIELDKAIKQAEANGQNQVTVQTSDGPSYMPLNQAKLDLSKKTESVGKNPQAGLMKDLFNKSADELKKIEDGEGAPKSPAEQGQPPLLEEESDEDKEIRRRIKMFREGKNPDKKMAGILDKPGEYDDLAIPDDPMIQPLVATDAASPLEERQLLKVVEGSGGWLFGDGFAKAIQVLKGQTSAPEGANRELYEPVSRVVFEVLKAQKQALEQDGTKASPSVFFSEDGAVPLVTEMVWDLAQQLDLPGSDDRDQYAASVINVMKMAGEHVLEAGDEEAIAEATNVQSQMVSAGLESDYQMQTEVTGVPQKKPLAQGIDNALLGGQV
jgi:hypothetical protein